MTRLEEINKKCEACEVPRCTKCDKYLKALILEAKEEEDEDS